MSITTTTSRKQYTSTGGTEYPVDFYFAADSDLVVVVTDADGADTTLVLTTDYTVTGAGEPTGGTVTTNEAVTSGYTVTIRRVLAQTQATRLKTQGGWYPSVHEGMFDRLTMLVQQQQEEINRCLKYDAPTLDADIDTDISAAIDARDAAIAAQGAAETAQGLSEDARDAAVVAQGFAEAAAAGLALPGLVAGDGGKMLAVEEAPGGLGYALRTGAQVRDGLGLGSAATLDAGTAEGDIPVLGSGGRLARATTPAKVVTALTDAATITPDLSSADAFTLTITEARNLGDATLPGVGAWPITVAGDFALSTHVNWTIDADGEAADPAEGTRVFWMYSLDGTDKRLFIQVQEDAA